MTEVKRDSENREVHGDHPPYSVPGEIALDIYPPTSDAKQLEAKAEAYLAKNPQIKNGAREAGQDIVAVRGDKILIGVEVATAVLATLTVGGIITVVLYKYQHKK